MLNKGGHFSILILFIDDRRDDWSKGVNLFCCSTFKE